MERDLDDLAILACSIFDVPVSFISFIDDNIQWFKAKNGFEYDYCNIDQTFCKYTLDKPQELLIIDSPETDERIKVIPQMMGLNAVKFYASAPLVSKMGNVIGTISILDYKKRDFNQKKYEELKLISKNIMKYIEGRKLMIEKNEKIEYNINKLNKIIDLAPGVLFKLSSNLEGKLNFTFLSGGIKKIIPSLCPEVMKLHPIKMLDFIVDGDRIYDLFKSSFDSLCPIETEFKVKLNDKMEKWCLIKAIPERRYKEVIWHGIIQETTQTKDHLNTVEKVLFDISHVIRKPVANILGLLNFLKSDDITVEEKQEILEILFNETNNLDEFINKLKNDYHKLKTELKIKFEDN